MVKLRQTPEDFIVTELGGPEPVVGEAMADCEHRLYRLEKRGHDSIALLARLSRELGVARRAFGIAGLKDRHAVTSQKVTIPAGTGNGIPKDVGDSIGDESDGLTGVGWRLTLLGGVEKKLRSGHHSGNRFEIIVRDMNYAQVQGLPRRLEQAIAHGWPNWFDSQRFGSAVGNRMPGTHIIAGEFEKAMKLHLTVRNKSDRSDKRRDKKKMAALWPKKSGRHGSGTRGSGGSGGSGTRGSGGSGGSGSGTESSLAELANLRVEHKPFRKPLKAIGRAQEEGKSGEELWLRAYMALPYDIRGLWLSAWQSEQWNNLLSDHLHELFDRHLLYPVKIGVGGPLHFPNAPAGKQGSAKRTLIEQIGNTLQNLPETIQMPHSDLDLSDIDQYLSDHPRPTMVHTEIETSEVERDEMNSSAKHKGWKASIGFDLPPGAYATVLVKRLFQ